MEGNAFTKASKCLLDDNAIDYNGIIEFCGKDYRQKLQVKLQGLRFAKGKNISTFINELLVTVKDLYNLDGVVDEDTIKSIALNHITSNLDKGLRQEAKVFQLGGNESLENLEFIELKMLTNSLGTSTVLMYGKDTNTENTRLDNLEETMKKILARLDKDKKKPRCILPEIRSP